VRDFENVHTTFTRHYVGGWIRSRLNELERQDLVTALKWEAACRRDDPIHGSYGVHRGHLKCIQALEVTNAGLIAQVENLTNQLGGPNNGNRE
jgi:hypothetical protein